MSNAGQTCVGVERLRRRRGSPGASSRRCATAAKLRTGTAANEGDLPMTMPSQTDYRAPLIGDALSSGGHRRRRRLGARRRPDRPRW
ncbi:hypothetical protein HBB16_14660 [Pseudonocardia sp. MCCB 268]|nr:hypothetical protein [Pseudonocardia cytotoxica]